MTHIVNLFISFTHNEQSELFEMTRAMIIYDTKFGNTEKVAKALAEGMKEHGVNVAAPRALARKEVVHFRLIRGRLSYSQNEPLVRLSSLMADHSDRHVRELLLQGLHAFAQAPASIALPPLDQCRWGHGARRSGITPRRRGRLSALQEGP